MTFDDDPSFYERAGAKVYHTSFDCPIGRKIREYVNGTGGLPKCPECDRRDVASEQLLDRQRRSDH